MGIVLIFIGSFLLYAKSKHFPDFLSGLGSKLKARHSVNRFIAYFLFVISLVLLGYEFGFWTGLVIFIITVMFALTLTITLLPLNKRYAYLLTALSLFVLLIEYAI